MLARRDAIPDEARAVLSPKILRRVLDLPAYREAGTVLAYASFGSEPDTTALLHHALQAGKTLLLPRIVRRARRLDLYVVRDPDRDLAPGFSGIREPRTDLCAPASPEAVDFVLVPGLAFDRAGRRLGYGGGFYDRLLAGGPPRDASRVAVAFEAQLVAEVPADPHDVSVEVLVTEYGTYPANPA